MVIEYRTWPTGTCFLWYTWNLADLDPWFFKTWLQVSSLGFLTDYLSRPNRQPTLVFFVDPILIAHFWGKYALFYCLFIRQILIQVCKLWTHFRIETIPFDRWPYEIETDIQDNLELELHIVNKCGIWPMIYYYINLTSLILNPYRLWQCFRIWIFYRA